jgi:putative photosynthetic complex assembly protein
MHAHDHHGEPIPRRILLGAGALLATSFALVAAARLSGRPARDPDAPVRAERQLRFEDQPDGGIAVIDASSGTLLETVHGEQGFLRGTLRSIARERRRRGIASGEPLQLVGRRDGRLSLIDAAAGTRIDLESFGPTNAAVFARWLDPASTLPR